MTHPGFRTTKRRTRAAIAKGIATRRANEKEAVLARMHQYLADGYRPPGLAEHKGTDEEVVAAWWELTGWGKEPEPMGWEGLVAILNRMGVDVEKEKPMGDGDA